jgi:hypothetical protein
MGLLAKASVAIDGSKFKAVNSRDNNFTKGKMERRLAQIEESVVRQSRVRIGVFVSHLLDRRSLSSARACLAAV